MFGTCEWCGKWGAIDRHHWPTAKKDGGAGTVPICPTCHRIFHAGPLIDCQFTRGEAEYLRTKLKKLGMFVLHHFPAAKNKYAIAMTLPYAVLNPFWMTALYRKASI